MKGFDNNKYKYIQNKELVFKTYEIIIEVTPR
jgi:hypothetical protein